MADMNLSFERTCRIGISQRNQPGDSETFERDALDAGWRRWFSERWPQSSFVAIPNFDDPAHAVRYFCDWRLDRLILSGGETPGERPLRDAVERALLDHARSKRLSVLGVCRGMQMLQIHSGGALVAHAGHVATPHRVRCGSNTATVNSWHSLTITSVPSDWVALAFADDETVEAMRHRVLPWLGVMWHPERAAGNPGMLSGWMSEILGQS